MSTSLRNSKIDPPAKTWKGKGQEMRTRPNLLDQLVQASISSTLESVLPFYHWSKFHATCLLFSASVAGLEWELGRSLGNALIEESICASTSITRRIGDASNEEITRLQKTKQGIKEHQFSRPFPCAFKVSDIRGKAFERSDCGTILPRVESS